MGSAPRLISAARIAMDDTGARHKLTNRLLHPDWQRAIGLVWKPRIEEPWSVTCGEVPSQELRRYANQADDVRTDWRTLCGRRAQPQAKFSTRSYFVASQTKHRQMRRRVGNAPNSGYVAAARQVNS